MENETPKQKFYSASEVAAILGCSRFYVSQRTNKERGIKGTKVGSFWVYEQKDVDDFKGYYRPLK